MFLARGLCFVVSLEAIQVKDPLVLGLQSTKLGFADWYITPTGIIAFVLVGVAAWTLVYTRFGRTVYAIGGNEQSARLMGLPVARTKVLVYVVSGVCAGIAGLLFTSYTAAGYSLNGIGTELDTIAAVVIGGTLLAGGSGYLLGSFVGVLVYGVIKVAITFLGADASWTRITIGILLLAFVVVQRLIVSRSTRR
jgi:simple sugar transport system permease protein